MDKGRIKFGAVLGKGAFGTVKLAQVAFDHDRTGPSLPVRRSPPPASSLALLEELRDAAWQHYVLAAGERDSQVTSERVCGRAECAVKTIVAEGDEFNEKLTAFETEARVSWLAARGARKVSLSSPI